MKFSSLNRMVSVAVMVFTAGMAQAVTYTVVDLNPSGFSYSVGDGTDGTHQVGSGYGLATGNYNHALHWSGTAGSAVDLNPSGFSYSVGDGTDGTHQVGYGYGPVTGDNYHALLWSGTAASAVDLNPSGFSDSYASGTNGTQQIGYGYGPATGDNTHALLWSGTAASAVDLNPSGFSDSYASGTNGTQQIGSGTNTEGQVYALLWNGTAASAVDLNPSGFIYSVAQGISGTQQVGCGSSLAMGNEIHALLWSGTAGSAVDLKPSGFTLSYALGTNGTQQIGYGVSPATGNYNHALLWSGTAGSAVDLHQFLPSGFMGSVANGIDAQGNIVGSAYDALGYFHAILWEPVPEPSTIVLLGLGTIGLLGWAWRRRASEWGRSLICGGAALLMMAVFSTAVMGGQNETGLGPAPFYNTTLRGDYVAAGTGTFSQSDPFSLTISGIPSGSTVVKALACWAYGTQQPGGPGEANIAVNGTPITGYLSGTGGPMPELLYPYTAAYMADVTSLVVGNGIYSIGSATHNQPPSGVSEGLSIVALYSNPQSPLQWVGLYQGLTHTYGTPAPASATLTFLGNQYRGGQCHLLVLAGDSNATLADDWYVNGMLASGSMGTGGPGNAWMGKRGQFWDHADGDASSSLTVGDTTLSFQTLGWNTPGYDDYILHPMAAVAFPIPEPSTWKGPGGGSFNLASNWTNISVPNGVNATANFSTNITAPSTVTLDSPVTLGTLNFNSSQSYTLAGASNLILQTSSGNASINVLAGSHEISVPVVINSNTIISGVGSLELSGGISGNHALTVLGNLTATSIQVDSLSIGTTGAIAVPEPSTLALLGMGAFGCLACAWRRHRG